MLFVPFLHRATNRRFNASFGVNIRKSFESVSLVFVYFVCLVSPSYWNISATCVYKFIDLLMFCCLEVFPSHFRSTPTTPTLGFCPPGEPSFARHTVPIQLSLYFIASMPTGDTVPKGGSSGSGYGDQPSGGGGGGENGGGEKKSGGEEKNGGKKIHGVITFPDCWNCGGRLTQVPPCGCSKCSMPN